MDSIYKKYYTTEILEKIVKFGYDEECSFHSIDCDDPLDLDSEVVAMPTPQEFFDWILNRYQFYISIIPEDDYKYGVVFRYHIYKRDYDDHFNLKLTKTGFRIHREAVENAVYDLLMNFEPINKEKINKTRALYKRFVESDTFNEVYKDKSIGEQMKIEE